MDARHARRYLEELRATAEWLRSATPEGARYKLWLGDVVEFVRVNFGLESAQMARVREALAAGRLPAGADERERTRAYLARLDRFMSLIDGFARAFPDPLLLVDPAANGSERPSQEAP